MPLDEIKNEFYRKDSDIEKRIHEESEFDPESAHQAGGEKFQEQKEWKKEEKKLTPYQKKAIKIVLITIGVCVVFAFSLWGIIKLKKTAFLENRVAVEFSGPEKVDSVQIVEYAIKYKNDNRVSLKNVEIFLNYAENFQPENSDGLEKMNASNSKITIGEIKPRSSGEFKLRGRFFAPEDYTLLLKSSFQYVPSNFNSVFRVEKNVNVEIKSSPISIEIDAPLEAASGNSIEYVIGYKNVNARQFENMRLEVEYPGGFTFTSAEPKPTEGNNFWYLGNLDEDTKGQIVIQGELTGEKNEAKVLKVYLKSTEEGGTLVSYGEREKLTRIVTSPLSIRQSVVGLTGTNVSTGGKLEYQLAFKNEGNIGLRNAIVTCEIKGAILDFSKIRVGETAYESKEGVITWKAVDSPQLANLQPKAEGTVSFSIPIFKEIPLGSERDKDFIITSVAKIDSPDIPTPVGANKIISSNKLVLKLNTDVALETMGYYDDPNIKNFGPIPPQVGAETSYVLYWLITNRYNYISDVLVESSLPTGVKWTGKTYPDGENISFNSRTNKIEWKIGNIKNGTGILSSKKEVRFQVSIIPEINSLGKMVPLLNPPVLTAKDVFTSENIKIESVNGKNTKLEEDKTLTRDDYQVVEAFEE